MGVYTIIKADLRNRSAPKEKDQITTMKAMEKVLNVIPQPATDSNNPEEREEGEIVDEYELISSEEEEYSVRERIKELEATNNELEQIAEISKSYSRQYNYHLPPVEKHLPRFPRPTINKFEREAQLVSDASYISPEEINTAKRRKRYKVKRSKREHNTKHHGRHRDGQYRPPHKKRRNGDSYYYNRHNDNPIETILIDSYDSLSDVERFSTDAEDREELEALKLNRDELRFALARDNMRNAPTGSLQERLNIKNHVPSRGSNFEKGEKSHGLSNGGHLESPINVVVESDSSDSLEEQELRLIALKSAVLKKHYARKKRDAEVAYSPTDFITKDTYENTAASDIDDIQDLMEISPVASPVRTASPVENTKPVDMDIATSESDNENYNKNYIEDYNWPPVGQVTMPDEIHDTRTFNALLPCAESIPYGFYMNGHFPAMVPAPIIIDDEEEAPPQKTNPFYLSMDQMDEASMSNNSCSLPDASTHSEQDTRMEMQQSSIENSYSSFREDPCKEVTESNDEEESALRAFLLARFQDTKATKSASNDIPKEEIVCIKKPSPYNDVHSKEAGEKDIGQDLNCSDNDDPEALRMLLLSSLSRKRSNPIKTNNAPIVLKEAVRRFQAISTNDCPLENTDLNETKENNYLGEIDDTCVRLSTSQDQSRLHLDANKAANINLEQSLQVAVTPGGPATTSIPKVKSINESGNDVTMRMKDKQNHSQNVETKEFLNKSNETKLNGLQASPIIAKDVPILEKSLMPCTAFLTTNHKEKITPEKFVSSTSVLNNSSTLNVAKPQSVKIVKPNKVINKNQNLKPKATTVIPPKEPKTFLSNDFNVSTAKPIEITSSSTSRLITTIDISSIKVQKMIICLKNSESDSSSDDEFSGSIEYNQQLYSSAYRYCDNFSPISLPMESPNDTPTRSNTPSSEMLDPAPMTNMRKSVMNDYFEKKLDDFLKEARSKVTPSEPMSSVELKKCETQTKQAGSLETLRPSEKDDKAVETPLAVRHLPVASQAEYLRLVKRMKVLERRKESKTSIENTKPTDKNLKKAVAVQSPDSAVGPSTAAASNVASKILGSITDTIVNPNENTQIVQLPVIEGISCLKDNKPSRTLGASDTSLDPIKHASIQTVSDTEPQEQLSKTSRLHAYELSFKKIGAGMVCNLDKSLLMVEQAKKAKVARLRHGQHLRELYKKIEEVKKQMKLEQTKISKIQPKIQSTHEIIISLKKKRNKLHEAAMDLGKSIVGDEYRLFDDSKEEIIKKSNLLTNQIRIVNALTVTSDLDKIEINDTFLEINGVGQTNTSGSKEEIEESADSVVDLEQEIQNVPNKLSEQPLQEHTAMACLAQVTQQNSNVSGESNLHKENNQLNLNAQNTIETYQQETRSPEKVLQENGASGPSPLTNKDDTENHFMATAAEVTHCCNTDESTSMSIEPTPLPAPVPATATQLSAIQPEKETALNKDVPMTTAIAYDASTFKELTERQRERRTCRKELSEYKSPLTALRYSLSQLDPHGLICPYELKGNCEDTDCSFMHLTLVQSGAAAPPQASVPLT